MCREIFEKLEDGDRILFNDRKLPLTVDEVDENRVHVKGPRGGEYLMFLAENDPELVLIASKGAREYASKVEGLREVGEWERKDRDSWEHTKSGETIELVRNEQGFWTLETGLEVDLPRYGFSSREFAIEEAEELVEKNPEG